MDVASDTAGAGLGRQGLGVNVAHARSGGIAAKVGTRVATVADLSLKRLVLARTRHWVADKHAETGLEGRDLAGLGRHVIHERTAVDLVAVLVVELEAARKLATSILRANQVECAGRTQQFPGGHACRCRSWP